MKIKFNVELVKEYMREKGISRARFCKEFKVSVPTLKLLFAGNSNVGILSIYKIARYMGKELKDMFLE